MRINLVILVSFRLSTVQLQKYHAWDLVTLLVATRSSDLSFLLRFLDRRLELSGLAWSEPAVFESAAENCHENINFVRQT